MEAFLAGLIALPTAVYSLLLALVLVYWLFVFLGFFEIDLFDIDLDGLAESGGGLVGILASLGLAGVPLTVSFSFLVLFAWVIALLGNLYLLPLFGTGLLGALVDTAWGLGALVVSLPLASRVVRPLRPLFAVHGAVSKSSYVGKPCTITSGSVDARFGQARIEHDGSDALLSVTCPEENQLTKGDRALIVDYAPEQDSYSVMPYPDV